MCGMYPLLIISCSTSLEWYALSRNRFCFLFLFLFVVNDDDDDGNASITIVTSWVFPDVITTDKSIPFYL